MSEMIVKIMTKYGLVMSFMVIGIVMYFAYQI